MSEQQTYRFIISGGGTGGHIYPAIAIANEIKARNAEHEILFVGATGRMEMEKVPQAGYRIEGLPISGIQRSLSLRNLSWPFRLVSSLLKAGSIVRREKPDAVVGVGGYASGPLLYMATKKGVPALVQEQNSFAGLTNKWLAKAVDTICVAHDGMEAFFPEEKIRFTGNPVRTDILEATSKREEAMKHFDLDPRRKTLLILGGSLGARTLNDSLVGYLSELEEAGINVIWQTGRFYYEEVRQKASGHNLSRLRILEFVREMDLAYAAADVVVSRAGALSVSELCLVAKPVIFVPSPNVAEDHQTKNAMALVNKNAALLVRDADARQKLVPAALNLLGDEETQKELSRHIAALARPNATKEIVDELMALIENNKN